MSSQNSLPMRRIGVDEENRCDDEAYVENGRLQHSEIDRIYKPGKSRQAAPFVSFDREFGYLVYSYTQSNSAFKAVIYALTISGDEIVWFLPCGVLGTVLVLFNMHYRALEMFAVSCVAATLESCLKLAFKRPRPEYAPQKDYSQSQVPGEEFSLPSGHSLRVGLAAFWMSGSDFSEDVFGFAAPPLSLTLLWAAAVAFSRIALGKHYPFDCAVGLLCGIGLGLLVENPDTMVSAGLCIYVHTICGMWVTYTWGQRVVAPMTPAPTLTLLLWTLYFGFGWLSWAFYIFSDDLSFGVVLQHWKQYAKKEFDVLMHNNE